MVALLGVFCCDCRWSSTVALLLYSKIVRWSGIVKHGWSLCKEFLLRLPLEQHCSIVFVLQDSQVLILPLLLLLLLPQQWLAVRRFA